MIFLSDCEFSRSRGSKNKFRKLRKSFWNVDTANAAAVGGGLGWGLGRAVDTFNKTGALGERYGVIAGTLAGTGLVMRSQYKRQK
ncbi:hypothetical protein [Scytonema sp. NUACC26]|uniref:hypothetical protein n=1 Tax=Scytonema sp. NUACC26 TaxID=3140176 RepID=UPI0034DC9D17